MLTRGGSDVHDWAKSTTRSIRLPSDQSRQMHFHKNPKTGAIDFNVKGTVPLDEFLGGANMPVEYKGKGRGYRFLCQN